MRSVSIGRHTIRVDDDQPTFWDRVEAGRWEPGTLAVLDRLVGPRTTFLDIGAWVGALSLYAAAQGAAVLAVEADPAALDQLGRNLAANPDIAERIDVIAAALSTSDEPVRLGARRKPGDSMSSALFAAAATSSWTADAITPATLAERVGRAENLFVKLDIEGGEYALLPAFGPLLARPPVAVLAAFHPALLRETRADVRSATEAALAAFAGWPSFRVGADLEIAADLSAVAAEPGGEWLFLSPEHPQASVLAGEGRQG